VQLVSSKLPTASQEPVTFLSARRLQTAEKHQQIVNIRIHSCFQE
jgi:hypothetical protein